MSLQSLTDSEIYIAPNLGMSIALGGLSSAVPICLRYVSMLGVEFSRSLDTQASYNKIHLFTQLSLIKQRFNGLSVTAKPKFQPEQAYLPSKMPLDVKPFRTVLWTKTAIHLDPKPVVAPSVN